MTNNEERSNLPTIKMVARFRWEDQIEIPLNRLAFFVGPLNATFKNGHTLNIGFDYFDTQFISKGDGNYIIEFTSHSSDIYDRISDKFVDEYRKLGVSLDSIDARYLGYDMRQLNRLPLKCMTFTGVILPLENIKLTDLYFKDTMGKEIVGHWIIEQFNERFKLDYSAMTF